MTDTDKPLTKIHFTIDKSKEDDVQKFKQKIEGLFEVDIAFDNNDQTCNKLWMSVEGKSCDCQDTKDYVTALCNPEESATVSCPCDDVGLKYEIFAGIEKNTRAVIIEKGNDKVEISGSMMSVTLALSSLEELLEAKLESTGGKDSGSRRLDNVLRETLSHLDGDLDDFESVPSNVKRAMIDSILHDTTIENIEDEELFDTADGANALTPTKAKTPTNAKRKTSYTKGFTQPLSETALLGIETHQAKRTRDNKSDDSFADLRKIAESAGYSFVEIEEGLLYVRSASDVKPNEFLPMLHNIREKKRELGLLPKKNRNVDDDNDVVFVGISPPSTRQKAPETPQNPNDMSIIEIKDEEEIKRLESLPSRTRNRNTTGEKKTDNDQTTLMTIWNQPSSSSGAIPKTTNKTSDTSSSTAMSMPVKPQSENKECQPVNTVESNVVNSAIISTRPTRWDKTSPIRKENSDSAALVEEINMPKAVKKNGDLRYVVVDGSNVARSHGNGSVFSCQGIKLCVDHFLQRGHDKITVFVPGWRQKKGTAANPIKNQEILEKLKKDGYLAFTPHRQLPSGQRVASYDDRFILDLADKEDGVIVSNDQYRDFFKDKASYRRLLEERCIPYVFVGDNFMLPEDPYGQHGKSLDDILVKPKHRPRARHEIPEQNYPRTQNAHTGIHYNQAQVYHNARQLQQQQQQQQYYQNYHQQYDNQYKNYPYYHNNQQPCYTTDNHYYRRRENTRSQTERHEKPVAPISRHQSSNFSAPQLRRESTDHHRQRHARLEVETIALFEQLKVVFGEEDQEPKILSVLNNHASETDINKLTNYCLNSMS